MTNVILMYHDVWVESPAESGFDSSGANVYKMPVDQFRKEMKLLAEVAPETLVTVDDGGVSCYTVIAPVLEEFGLRGHFYITTDYIGKQGFMTEEQVKKLAERGYVIGSHSCSHPMNINTLTKGKRSSEWSESVAEVNRILGKKSEMVSIPNGYYNNDDLKRLASLGIKTVYTSSLADNFEKYGLKVVGRIGLTSHVGIELFENYLTNPKVIAKIQRKQKMLSLVKSAMGPMYNHTKKLIRKFIH